MADFEGLYKSGIDGKAQFPLPSNSRVSVRRLKALWLVPIFVIGTFILAYPFIIVHRHG